MTNNWLTYKDIFEVIDKLTKDVSHDSIIKYHLTSKKQIDDLVGKIISKSQESEMQVKAFMGKLKIDRKSLSIKGIGDLIAHLCNKNLFNEEQAYILRSGVKVRNYVIHHFYTEMQNPNIYPDLKSIEFILNSIIYILDLSINVVKNTNI